MVIRSKTLTFGLRENYTKNFLIYMAVLLFLLSGFLIGVYLFSYLEVESVNFIKNDFIEYMNTIRDGKFNFFQMFKSSLISTIIPILIFVLFSTSIVFSPLSLVMLSIKGFTVGFTITFILTNFGFKGFLLAFFTILLHNIFLIFLYIILCVKSISRGILKTKIKEKFNIDNSISLRFILLFCVLSVVISFLFQCLVTPGIIKLVF